MDTIARYALRRTETPGTYAIVDLHSWGAMFTDTPETVAVVTGSHAAIRERKALEAAHQAEETARAEAAALRKAARETEAARREILREHLVHVAIRRRDRGALEPGSFLAGVLADAYEAGATRAYFARMRDARAGL